MDRRGFLKSGLTVSALVATTTPRAFVRTFTDREGSILTASATVRLYDFGKLVIEQDVELLVDKTEDRMVFGQGQDILIDGDNFSFDKCTITLKEFPEVEANLPLQSYRHTITKGNTVTLSAHPMGFLRMVDETRRHGQRYNGQ